MMCLLYSDLISYTQQTHTGHIGVKGLANTYQHVLTPTVMCTLQLTVFQ